MSRSLPSPINLDKNQNTNTNKNFVKVFAVSDQLKASSTEIFLNLVTLEDSAFTIKLNERGFEVVGHSLDTNNTEG